MPQSEDPFLTVCARASAENWCWNIFCTTCGAGRLKTALRQLALEHKDPILPPLAIGNLAPLWSFRISRALIAAASRIEIRRLSQVSRFPDWLGYLGLTLFLAERAEARYRQLTASWVPQLLELVEDGSVGQQRLQEIRDDHRRILRWPDLELIEISVLPSHMVGFDNLYQFPAN